MRFPAPQSSENPAGNPAGFSFAGWEPKGAPSAARYSLRPVQNSRLRDAKACTRAYAVSTRLWLTQCHFEKGLLIRFQDALCIFNPFIFMNALVHIEIRLDSVFVNGKIRDAHTPGKRISQFKFVAGGCDKVHI